MRFSLSAVCFLAASAAWLVVGCGEGVTKKPSGTAPSTGTAGPQSAKEPPAAASSEEEKQIQESLAKLSPEDRKLLAEQGYCVISQEAKLGSMGPPIKLNINDQAVFVCCGGCKKNALDHPEKTLAAVEELKAKVKAEKAK